MQSQHLSYVGVRPYEDIAKRFTPKPQEIPAADKTAGEAEKETEVPAAQ
jgi:hypothetical protein